MSEGFSPKQQSKGTMFVVLLVIVGTLLTAIFFHNRRSVHSAALSSGRSVGYLVNGGHLYRPYMYYHWTQGGSLVSGSVTYLEPAMGASGYEIHTYFFSGSQAGQWVTLNYMSGSMQGSHERLRLSNGLIYVREQQTGAAWWQPGKAMSEAQWALHAVHFMECYKSAYDAGNPSKSCTNFS